MSISTYVPRSDYIGTGILDTYSFDFTVTDKSQILIAKYDDAGDLVWVVDGEDLTYLSSSSFNEDGGGQVVLAADLEVDYTLHIIQNAVEPIQTKQFKRSTHWTLEQFESALDLLGLQLQSVAYKANRAPILGNMVTQAVAEAFDYGVEVVADAVIAFNADGDGFETVPRSTFVGNTGATGATGPAGANGTDGVGILRAGNQSLSSAASSVTVAFSTATADTSYVPNFVFVNVTDSSPIFMMGIVTGKTTSGFTVTFNTPTDTANYSLAWQVNDAI